MCGISGIIKKNEIVQATEVQLLNHSILHRGPDAKGVWTRENVGFGHQRLSILDLSKAGTQPMSIEDLTICFNGEIYNYIEIRDELKALNYRFNSNTDTEVILKAYQEWGINCVKKFNGMWAFAIFDQSKRTVYFSRDRFGIKPFHYKLNDSELVFGSEIKQLLDNSPRFKMDVLMNYLVLGYENYSSDTFYKDVLSLPGGHNASINIDSFEFKIFPFYSIEKNQRLEDISLEKTIELYDNSFNKATELRLRSDVTVGSCISGGLDSSYLVAHVREILGAKKAQDFNLINATTGESSTDESNYAKIVAKHLGMNYHQVSPSSKDFIENLDNVIHAQEEPFSSTSIFMQYFVLEKARELGCTVMLDGQAGDEILLGYRKYYASYINSLSGFSKLNGLILSAKNSGISASEIIKLWVYFLNGNARYRRLLNRWNIIKREYTEQASKKLILDLGQSFKNIEQLQKKELLSTQLPHLLRYEDRNSMRHSIEARLPYTDYKHLELALSVNNKFKIKDGWTKYIQRKAAAKYLPEKIAWRKNKLGFESPQKTWLNSADDYIHSEILKSAVVRELVKDVKLTASLDEKMKWKLFNIARLEQLYGVSL